MLTAKQCQAAFSQRPAVEEIIEQARNNHYSGGWSFPAKPFNWALYLFAVLQGSPKCIRNIRQRAWAAVMSHRTCSTTASRQMSALRPLTPVACGYE
jgi:hypothetical protein